MIATLPATDPRSTVGNAAPWRLGEEFLINTTTQGNQADARVTALADGRFVVVWTDDSQTGGDTSDTAIRGQVFEADGSKAGNEFLANTTAQYDQFDAQVTALSDGRFVVVWAEFGNLQMSSGYPGSADTAIRAQIFDASGGRAGTEFQVNSSSFMDQTAPTVTALADGRFFVTYNQYNAFIGQYDGPNVGQIYNADGTRAEEEIVDLGFGSPVLPTALGDGRVLVTWPGPTEPGGFPGSERSIRAQIYNTDGSPEGPEVLVDTTTQIYRVGPVISEMSGGGFVIVWAEGDSRGDDPPDFHAQALDADGRMVGAQFMVDANTRDGQSDHRLTVLDNGRFVVTWEASGNISRLPFDRSIWAQVFEADGTRVGTETLAFSTSMWTRPENHSVASLNDGRFVIVRDFFADPRTAGDADDLRAQVYEADGSKLGAEFVVNTTTQGIQFIPTITALTGGQFVITFGDTSQTGGDTSGEAIRAQIFDADRLLSGDVRISGGAGVDVLFGGAGNDTLEGGGSNDHLEGRGGNDLLNGETKDTTFDPVAAQVFRLYQAALDRAPDPTGYANWTDRLLSDTMTLQQAANAFVGSAEFQSTYGNTTNTAFVTLLYNNVLDRGPDAGGLAGWTGQLDTGALTRADVVLRFSESAEFTARSTADALSFSRAGLQADWADNVYRLYQAALDRNPDPAGFEGWTTALAAGRAILDVISGFVNSAEFQNTYGNTTNAEFVTLLYDNVLNRLPDAGGLAGWTGQLGTGALTRAEVVLRFSESAEFGTSSGDALVTWMRAHGGDRLEGGSGNNILFGGIGADTFVFDTSDRGTQIIADIEAWDRVEIDNSSHANANALISALAQSGSDVLLGDNGMVIRFENADLSAFDTDMFIFV